MAITGVFKDKGFIGEEPSDVTHEYRLIDNRVYRIHNIIVHTFRMGDVEDPDLMAGEPLYRWQESDMGKWVMSKAVETPMWHRQSDPANYGWKYAISAKLKDKDFTFYQLKWANQKG